MNSNQDRLPGGRFVYASNDYWVDTQQSEIELSDLAPEGPYDAAILLGLLPDNTRQSSAARMADPGSRSSKPTTSIHERIPPWPISARAEKWARATMS